MSFTEKDYDTLVTEFHDNVTYLRGRHGVPDSKSLPEPRRSQVHFLEITIQILSEADTPPETKKDIFCGAMLTILFEIESEYTMRDAQNSKMFVELSKTLDISEENPPKAEAKKVCFEKMLNFLEEQIYVGGNSERGLKSHHPFSELEDKIYDIHREVNSLAAGARNEALQRNIEAKNPLNHLPPGSSPRTGFTQRLFKSLGYMLPGSPTAPQPPGVGGSSYPHR